MEKKYPTEKLICRYLKAKNSFGMIEGGENPWYGIDDPNTTFWCNKTSGPIGPDNLFCDPRSCKPGRKCYREHDE
jgi:hypothetical protein